MKDPAEFLEGVKIDLFQDEVYVFTPKGDVRVFPRGATPIDFAYQIHTQLGDHVTGARINGKIEPLRYKLRNGDVVEVLTSPHQHPNKDWLDFAGTTRARTKIRNFFRQDQRDKSKRLGEELFEKELRKAGISTSKLLKNEPEMRRIFDELKVQNLEEMLVGIGYGKIDPEDIVKVVSPPDEQGKESKPPEELREGRLAGLVRKVIKRDDSAIRINGIDDVLVRYAKCCNPLPGDDILGFITRGRGVTIHRRGCPEGLRHRPRAPRRDHLGQPGAHQPQRAASRRHGEPARHPRERRADVHGPGHQHQRGQLQGGRRRARREPLLVRVRRPAAAQAGDEGAHQGEGRRRGRAGVAVAAARLPRRSLLALLLCAVEAACASGGDDSAGGGDGSVGPPVEAGLDGSRDAGGGGPDGATDAAGTGEGGVTLASACDDNATAYCAQLAKCSPYLLATEYGDTATCVSRLAYCTDIVAAKGSGWTADGLVEACVKARSKLPCESFLYERPAPADCTPAGTLKTAAQCLYDTLSAPRATARSPPRERAARARSSPATAARRARRPTTRAVVHVLDDGRLHEARSRGVDVQRGGAVPRSGSTAWAARARSRSARRGGRATRARRAILAAGAVCTAGACVARSVVKTSPAKRAGGATNAVCYGGGTSRRQPSARAP